MYLGKNVLFLYILCVHSDSMGSLNQNVLLNSENVKPKSNFHYWRYIYLFILAASNWPSSYNFVGINCFENGKSCFRMIGERNCV